MMALRAMSSRPFDPRAAPPSSARTTRAAPRQCCWRFSNPRRRRVSAGNRRQVGATQCPVEQGGHPGFGQPFDGGGQSLLRPFHAIHVLLEVRDGLALDVGEHRVVGRLLAEQALEVAVELAHTGQQGRVMALHFGQAEVDAGIEGVGGRLGQHVGQVVEPVPDGVQHGGLQADGVAQALEGVEEAADAGLALGVSDHWRFFRSNSSGVL